MKFVIFVVFAMLAAAFAFDTNPATQGQAVLGWGAGAAGVVGLGLTKSASGLVANGPAGALAGGAEGVREGANFGQNVGGQGR